MKSINVNELKEAIEQYKGVKIDLIEKVDVGNNKNKFTIGVGGILTVYYNEE